MPTEKKGTLLWAKVTTLMCKIQLCLNKLLQYLMIFNLQNKSKAVQFYSCFKLKRQLFEYFAYIKHQIYCFFIFWRQVLVSFWHKQENSRNVYIMTLHLLLLQLSLFNLRKSQFYISFFIGCVLLYSYRLFSVPFWSQHSTDDCCILHIELVVTNCSPHAIFLDFYSTLTRHPGRTHQPDVINSRYHRNMFTLNLSYTQMLFWEKNKMSDGKIRTHVL